MFGSKEVFPEFPALFKLFPSLLQDYAVFLQVTLRFGLFTESREEDPFKTLLILELSCALYA